MTRAGLAVAAALACLVLAEAGVARPAIARSAWPKVTRLHDGSTVSVWRDGRVVERSRSGQLLADSSCGSYVRYARWARFMTGFRSAVLRHDRVRVAASVARPLLWNHGSPWRSTAISSRAQLLRLYGAIFVPAVVREVKEADPRALFCKDVSMVMLGSGVAWGDERGGRPAIVSVNGPG